MPFWFPAVASFLLALFPVIIWLRMLAKEGERKGLYVRTFLLGTLSVIPPFLLILLFSRFPHLNIYSIINRTVEQVALAALLTNIVVGIIEEIAKNLIVRVIDKRHPEYLQTIGSALRLSICAGLGFSFAENIFYFYNIWINPQYGYQDLFSTFVFRSIFTMCAHMVFSGIFGYYFGLGKFAADLTEYSRWQGHHLLFSRFLSRLSWKMTFQVVREEKNLTGLFLAMLLHAAFNVSLDFQHKIFAMLIVAGAALYIAYLLETKSGHLLFSIMKRRISTMAPADEDVVMELLGMWFTEGRFKEVIQICDRLLARDPENNVVKLFRARALDNQKLQQLYKALKGVFKKTAPAFQRTEGSSLPTGSSLAVQDEKVILEAMSLWYKEGKYREVLGVAERLLARNPQSVGARLLLKKAFDREKLQKVFDSLSKLFQGSEEV